MLRRHIRRHEPKLAARDDTVKAAVKRMPRDERRGAWAVQDSNL